MTRWTEKEKFTVQIMYSKNIERAGGEREEILLQNTFGILGACKNARW